MEKSIANFPNLGEAVPFRDGLAIISAKPNRLILDFLEEARKRKSIDIKRAELLATKINFCKNKDDFIDHVVEDHRRKGFASKIWRITNMFEKLSLPLTKLLSYKDVMGATYCVDTSPAIYISPSNIVINTSIPREMSIEVAEAKIIENTYRTWREEREHLIRILESKSISEDKVNKSLRVTASMIGQQLIFWGTYQLRPEIISGAGLSTEDQALKLLGTIVLSVGVSTAVTDSLWYSLLDKNERVSKKQGRYGDNLPNLFDFQFEKN